jgi:hypothetical protein
MYCLQLPLTLLQEMRRGRHLKRKILYLPEKNAGKPNACSFLRMVSPLSALSLHSDYIVEELVSLGQLFMHDVLALTTNRTAFLDFPGLSDLILNGNFPPIQLHWDTDDYSSIVYNQDSEKYYLQKLSFAQHVMEIHATILTTSTEFIRINSPVPDKWCVVRNSVPVESWKNSNQKNPNSLLFFGLSVHKHEVQRLSDSFDNIKWSRLKKSKISIEVVGNFTDKLNRIFRLTKVPQGNIYYPRFANWLANQSNQLTGLILIEDSILNRGKSALKFLEYSAMGMATAGYSHPALDTDLTSKGRYFEISRGNPAEDLLNLISEKESLVRSSGDNYIEVFENRRTNSDKSGMFYFYLKNLFVLRS